MIKLQLATYAFLSSLVASLSKLIDYQCIVKSCIAFVEFVFNILDDFKQ